MRFFFSVFAFKQFEYNLCRYSFYQISCSWAWLSFLDLWVYNVHQIRDILVNFFPDIFSVTPLLWKLQLPVYLAIWNFFTVHWYSVYFLCFFFFSVLFWIIFIAISSSSPFFSVMSNLLIPCSVLSFLPHSFVLIKVFLKYLLYLYLTFSIFRLVFCIYQIYHMYFNVFFY